VSAPDVVIIGAGLAGLTAARTLAARGRSVVVLEARDRVGGRTYTKQINGVHYDLGGQWLGPTQRRMLALCKELDIETFPQYITGRRVLEVRGKRSTYKGTIPSVSIWNLLALHRTMSRAERLRKTVPLDGPARAAKAAEWDAMTVETWKRETIPFRDGRELFDIAVRTVFGAEPAELSLLHFLFYLNSGGGFESLVETNDGAQQTRFVPGAQSVAIKMAAQLGERVILNAPVESISQTSDGVIVKAASGEYRAAHAILAIPPALAARLRYSPELPVLRDQLTQRFPMGATIKAVATYDRPFWREDGLSGEAISTEGPVTATFDDTSHDGARPALLGFIVGKEARTWGARPEAERRAAVIASFARFFGKAAESPTGYFDHDWSNETYTRGCPVGALPPGAWTLFGAAWRAPVGRLHFAGTETASEWNGYMEGAVESGERAAAEIESP